MALAHWQRTITDGFGNVVSDATVEVRRHGEMAILAPIKADREGLSPKPNPFTVDAGGNADFFALGGPYQIKASAVIGGVPWEKIWTYSAIGTAAETDAASGNAGGNLLTFASETADADPGDGKIRFNHADPESVTWLYIDDDNAFGQDITALLDSFDDFGGANTKGYLRLQVDGNAVVWAEFSVVGSVVVGAGYRKVPVSLVSHGGEMAANDALTMFFNPAGPGAAQDISYEPGPGFSGAADNAKAALDEAGEKLQHITVTQAVNLDTIEARVNSLDAAVVLRGTWSAASGAFPATGGGGTAGAVIAGDSWIVSTGGTVGGVEFAANDRIIAITDGPSTSVFAANWFKADYTDLLNGTTLGAALAAATAKTTPVDADTLGIGDSAASGVWKKLTLANLKAWLFTSASFLNYFDMTEETEPGTPASGKLRLFANGNKLWIKDDLGVAAEVGSGGGGGDVTKAQLAERDMALANAMAAPYPFVNGWADSFNVSTYVDAANSVNEDLSIAGEVRGTRPVYNYPPGTNIGNMVQFGGLAAAFDGATSQADSGGSGRNNQGAGISNGYVGKTTSQAWPVLEATVYGSNNSGFVMSGNPSVTLYLYGKQGAAPASGTDGSILGSLTFTDTVNESAGRTIVSTDQNTLWDHIWIYLDQPNNANVCIAEVVFRVLGTTDNLDLRTITRTADAVPSTVDVFLMVRELDTLTPDTDIKIYASRIGNTGYVEGVEERVGVLSSGGGIYIWRAVGIDVTGQASGQNLRARVALLNNKRAQILAIAVYARP